MCNIQKSLVYQLHNPIREKYLGKYSSQVTNPNGDTKEGDDKEKKGASMSVTPSPHLQVHK